MVTANPRFKQPIFLPYLKDQRSDTGISLEIPAFAFAWCKAYRLLAVMKHVYLLWHVGSGDLLALLSGLSTFLLRNGFRAPGASMKSEQ